MTAGDGPPGRPRRAPWPVRHRKLLIAVVATAVVLGPIAYLWASSLVPGTYSMMDMGYPDYGGGAAPGTSESHSMQGMPGMAGMHGTTGVSEPAGSSAANPISVDRLTADPDRPADVSIDLVARQQVFQLTTGRSVDGFTLNGTSPGPEIRAVQGQLVEVHLINESVPDGITLHWHGVDVPNADDGVAGVTQDAVPVGGRFVYRFVVDQAGTYWYHSHQVSDEQVIGGLFGALVVTPEGQGSLIGEPADLDQLALVHLYDGKRTINGADGDVAVPATAGDRVRVRVINTDNGPMQAWVIGAAYRLVAVDGTDLNQPGELTDRSVEVTAGGRADLEIVVPKGVSYVRVVMGGSNSLLVGPGTAAASVGPAGPPPEAIDLLGYGAPAALGLDPASADRTFEYTIGRRVGFLDGLPGFWWTINGHLFPDVPMFVVSEGDVVVMHIRNDSGEVHPMHLHGHHAVVLSRNGVAATGSPWWVDSLNVNDGESYDIAFRADNPGIWMDHCHNLPHAAEGLVAHLMYEGVTDPYLVGGDAHNEPE